MGDLQAGEWRQQPWRRSGSFLGKLLVGQGKAGDSTAHWEGRRLSWVLGSAPVRLTFQSWGPWMLGAVWPRVCGCSPYPKGESLHQCGDLLAFAAALR